MGCIRVWCFWLWWGSLVNDGYEEGKQLSNKWQYWQAGDIDILFLIWFWWCFSVDSSRWELSIVCQQFSFSSYLTVFKIKGVKMSQKFCRIWEISIFHPILLMLFKTFLMINEIKYMPVSEIVGVKMITNLVSKLMCPHLSQFLCSPLQVNVLWSHQVALLKQLSFWYVDFLT